MIRRLQSFRGPALDLAMKGFSFLGNEAFFVLLFPVLYWCLDSRLGLRLAVAYFLSGILNFALKQSLAQPRPADLAAGINLVEQPGYGLPSGHAQGAVVLWGLLALHGVLRWARRWLWAPAAFLMLAVGLSRVYLGVHFPTDVLAGWAVGALVLGAVILVIRRLPALEPHSEPAPRLATADGPAVRRAGAGSPPPARRFPWWVWIPIAGLLGAAALALRPEKDSVAMVAAMWGFLTGHLVRRRYWGGEQGTVAQRLLRPPAGLVVLLGLYLGLKRVFPAEGQALYLPLRFLRYVLVGAWVALGAPLLFRWLGLASRDRAAGITPGSRI